MKALRSSKLSTKNMYNNKMLFGCFPTALDYIYYDCSLLMLFVSHRYLYKSHYSECAVHVYTAYAKYESDASLALFPIFPFHSRSLSIWNVSTNARVVCDFPAKLVQCSCHAIWYSYNYLICLTKCNISRGTDTIPCTFMHVWCVFVYICRMIRLLYRCLY